MPIPLIKGATENSLFLIAEIGVNHDGDFERAKDLVCKASQTGFDAVKFQYWIEEELLSKHTRMAPYQGSGNQEDLLKELRLTLKDLEALNIYAKSLGFKFIVSAFGARALDDIALLMPDAIKVPSGEAGNPWLLEKLASLSFPIIVSTGMLGHDEINYLKGFLDLIPNKIVMHCVSAYPAKISDCNFKRIEYLKDTFKSPIGFSDHTIGDVASVIAIAHGCVAIEKHITWSNSANGPDHKSSLEVASADKFVSSLREAFRAVESSDLSLDEIENAKFVKKALYLNSDIKPGDKLSVDSLIALRPLLDGIPAIERDTLIGEMVVRAGSKGEMLEYSHLGYK